MQRDDLIRLRHMLDAAREAMEFTLARTRADLDADRQLVLSLVKCIEIVGEAAGRVSSETRSLYSHIPWLDIVDMRNHLVHVYFDIDVSMVWDTVIGDLPPLAAELTRILAEAKDVPSPEQ